MNIDWVIVLAVLFYTLASAGHSKRGSYDPTAHLTQSTGHALANVTEPVGLLFTGILFWAIWNHDLVGAALTRLVESVR